MSWLTEPQKAWLACAIDGEGSIGVVMSSHGKKKGLNYHYEPYRTPTLAIVISNTDPRFLQHTKEILGRGYVFMRTKTYGKFSKKPLGYFNVRGNQLCREILAAIWPYMILKQAQAKTALARTEASYQRGLGKMKPRLNEFVQDYETGMPVTKMATKYGIHASSVSRLAIKCGFRRDKPHTPCGRHY